MCSSHDDFLKVFQSWWFLYIWDYIIQWDNVVSDTFYSIFKIVDVTVIWLLFLTGCIPSKKLFVSLHINLVLYLKSCSIFCRSYPWMSVSLSNDTYWISICSAVNHAKCPTGSSICRERSGSFISVGNYTSSPSLFENEDKEITVSYTGGVCPSNSSTHLKTDIIFKCGKTLVSWSLLLLSSTVVDFLSPAFH